MLSSLKSLRGTLYDLFGYAAVRREERELIDWYRGLMVQVLQNVTPASLSLAQEVSALPDQIRGYENIKMENIRRVKKLAEEKLGELQRSARELRCHSYG